MPGIFLYTAVIAFALGVAFQTYFPLGVFFGIFLFMAGASIFIHRAVFLSRKNTGTVLLVCFLSGLGLGIMRMDIAQIKLPEFFEEHVSEEVEMEAVIIEKPDQRAKNTQLVVRPEFLKALDVHESNQIWKAKKETNVNVLLFASRYENYRYGEKILAQGVLKKPENFKNENGREFDYVNFLAKDHIKYIMYYPQVEKISLGHGNWIKEKLFVLKDKYLSSIARLIPEPASSLLGGLVVGAKQSLGDELLEKFRETGLIHIVVLSGYNVTLVAYFLMNLFSFLRPKFSAAAGLLGILLFALLVGGGATVIRASLMASLVVVARTTGRTADMIRLLFLAGFLMMLWNPSVLLHDPSFQLSFIATFGLLVFAPVLYQKLRFIPEKFFLRETASATLATQVFVLPMLLFMTGEVSLVSVPVNLLVLLCVPLIMFFGFLAGVIGFISTALAIPFAYVSYVLLSYIFFVVGAATSIPFASVSISTFSFWTMMFMYFSYGVFYFFLSFMRKRKQLSENKKPRAI